VDVKGGYEVAHYVGYQAGYKADFQAGPQVPSGFQVDLQW